MCTPIERERERERERESERREKVPLGRGGEGSEHRAKGTRKRMM
jgi:hypothetical protein